MHHLPCLATDLQHQPGIFVAAVRPQLPHHGAGMIEGRGVILQERAVLVDVVTVRPPDRKEIAAHCSNSRPCEAELLRYLTFR